MAAADTRTHEFASDINGATQPVNTQNANKSTSSDPFATQRTDDNNPFTENSDDLGALGASPTSGGFPRQDRRESKEWDASKVPPSRFQKREGSIYATPGSRDGHTSRNKAEAFAQKLKEKGWK
ncbi:MAG: hypothetical protein M1825_006286 [Sarcosagium campestre]|nr:MAG: hypothetical protein M1825_006286 [Sarcosagium campestre]